MPLKAPCHVQFCNFSINLGFIFKATFDLQTVEIENLYDNFNHTEQTGKNHILSGPVRNLSR